jgi:hypothetical protein
MGATDTHATIEELLEAVFSVRKYKRLKLGGGKAYDRSSD